MTDLSIVILSWNTSALLRACLDSIYKEDSETFPEVIVVDNASDDESVSMVERGYADVILIRNQKNEGYARGNNIGMERSSGNYILLLNSDTELKPGALRAMTSFLDSHPDYGACGAQLHNPDGSLQRACMRFPKLWDPLFFDTFIERLWPRNPVVQRYFMRDFDHAHSCDVQQPPGACFMVRRSLVDAVGMLDEDLFLFYNDVDFCRRIWKTGFKIRYIAEAKVLHHGGASTSKYHEFGLELHRNRVRYFRKYFGLAGAAITKFAVMLLWIELLARNLKEGHGLRSPGSRNVTDVFKEILKT
ncbi:MAG: glycosyltransferase family 2 protein [Planctomycetota bacterium]